MTPQRTSLLELDTKGKRLLNQTEQSKQKLKQQTNKTVLRLAEHRWRFHSLAFLFSLKLIKHSTSIVAMLCLQKTKRLMPLQ